MYLTTEKKQEIFKKHGKSEKDTGSAEGQIALFSFRINHLTEHLKVNKKDFGTQRSLIRLVGKRRSLLDYLQKTDIARYRAIVKELDLRKYYGANCASERAIEYNCLFAFFLTDVFIRKKKQWTTNW